MIYEKYRRSFGPNKGNEYVAVCTLLTSQSSDKYQQLFIQPLYPHAIDRPDSMIDILHDKFAGIGEDAKYPFLSRSDGCTESLVYSYVNQLESHPTLNGALRLRCSIDTTAKQEPKLICVTQDESQRAEILEYSEPPLIHMYDVGKPFLCTLQDPRKVSILRTLCRSKPVPSKRSGHVFLPYKERHCIILHGGQSGTFYNDTWSFDVMTREWTELVCTAEPFSGTPYMKQNSESGMPDGAFGQAGVIYHDENSVPCLGIWGGYNEYNNFISHFYSLNLTTHVWSIVPLSNPLPATWGAVGAVLRQKHGRRRVACSHALCPIKHKSSTVDGLYDSYDDSSKAWNRRRNNIHERSEGMKDKGSAHSRCAGAEDHTAPAMEQHPTSSSMSPSNTQRKSQHRKPKVELVVLVGGETEMGCTNAGYIIHLNRRITETDLKRNPLLYFHNTKKLDNYVKKNIYYDNRIAYNNAKAKHSSYSRSSSLYTKDSIEEWKKKHKTEVHRWCYEEVKHMVGTYWVENCTPAEMSPRRRSCGAVYKDNFLFVFGGRNVHVMNDMWVLNIHSRRWLHVRTDVPSRLMRHFYMNPMCPNASARVHAFCESFPDQEEIMKRICGSHMYSRSQHFFSDECAPKPRTGACAVADNSRHGIIIFGGYSTVGRTELYGDFHMYSILENKWSSVNIALTRKWDAHFDARHNTLKEQHALVDCHLTHSPCLELNIATDSSKTQNSIYRFCATNTKYCPDVLPYIGLGSRQYIYRHLCSHNNTVSTETATAKISSRDLPSPTSAVQTGPTYCCSDTRNLEVFSGFDTWTQEMTEKIVTNKYYSCRSYHVYYNSNSDSTSRMCDTSSAGRRIWPYPPPALYVHPLRRRPANGSCGVLASQEMPCAYQTNAHASTSGGDDDDGYFRPHREYFRLPVSSPCERTMAALSDDPVCPGSRFFLLGGTDIDNTFGDFYEIRISVFDKANKLRERLSRSSKPADALERLSATGIQKEKHLEARARYDSNDGDLSTRDWDSDVSLLPTTLLTAGVLYFPKQSKTT